MVVGVVQLWALLTVLGLVGPSVSLLLGKLDFTHRETELSHLVGDEI